MSLAKDKKGQGGQPLTQDIGFLHQEKISKKLVDRADIRNGPLTTGL
jgi:hypothetical protein